MLTELPRLDAEPAPADADLPDNRDHPMRRVTEAVVADPASWTGDRAAGVAEVFDGLAAGWDERVGGDAHLVPLLDALDRGAVAGQRLVEVGSGTGLATPTLAARFPVVVAVDLALEMLRRAPADPGLRVRADGACLPLADGWADAVVLVNAFLFPDEVDRVLDRDGTLVWVNSIGARTPIHLPADQVVAALPGSWDAVASAAGDGNWCVARRAGPA
jgi:SAM-dependent methyltransferase